MKKTVQCFPLVEVLRARGGFDRLAQYELQPYLRDTFTETGEQLGSSPSGLTKNIVDLLLGLLGEGDDYVTGWTSKGRVIESKLYTWALLNPGRVTSVEGPPR